MQPSPVSSHSNKSFAMPKAADPTKPVQSTGGCPCEIFFSLSPGFNGIRQLSPMLAAGVLNGCLPTRMHNVTFTIVFPFHFEDAKQSEHGGVDIVKACRIRSIVYGESSVEGSSVVTRQ